MKTKILNWINQWKRQFEKRTFDCSENEDQEQLQKALEELVKHAVHFDRKVSIATVSDEDGIKTVYLSFIRL